MSMTKTHQVTDQVMIVMTDVNDENNFGYVFIDIEILISVINNLTKCKQCGSNVKTIHDLSKKQGLANFFRVTCSNSYCDYEDTFINSKPIKEETSGRQAYDINIRSIVGFREIGKGHTAMNKFCGFMNMPKPLIKHLKTTKLLRGVTPSPQAWNGEKFVHKMNLQGIALPTSIFRLMVHGYALLNGLVTIIAMVQTMCRL